MGIDTVLLQFVVGLRHPLLTEFFIPITALGSLIVSLVILAGLAVWEERDTAILGLFGIVVAGGLGELLNVVVRRPRPDTALQLLPETAGGYAFPSGHTILAFVLATVLASRYGHRTYFYGLALFVAISRVYLGVHYPLDVVGGILIGWGTGSLLVRYADPILARLAGHETV